MSDSQQPGRVLRYAGRLDMDFRGSVILEDHSEPKALYDILSRGRCYAKIEIISMPDGAPLIDLTNTEAYRLLHEMLGLEREAAKEWLLTPAVSLNGRLPLELLLSEAGRAEVEAVIKGLGHGNFL